MPINLLCPSCQARYQVPDSLLGKQVRCRKCQKPIAVKEVAPAQSLAPTVELPVQAPVPATSPATARAGSGKVVALGLVVVGVLGIGSAAAGLVAWKLWKRPAD